jgi:hypothetical protein
LCLPNGSERGISGSNPKAGQLKLTFDRPIEITPDWSVSSIQLEQAKMSYKGVAVIFWEDTSLNPNDVRGRYFFELYRPSAHADWSRFGDSAYGVNSVGLLGPGREDRSLRLDTFDRFDREGFLKFALTNRLYVSDGGWKPGSLSVAFNPDRLSDIQQWLRAQPDRLAFKETIPPNTCGADAVFADLSVPPSLSSFMRGDCRRAA